MREGRGSTADDTGGCGSGCHGSELTRQGTLHLLEVGTEAMISHARLFQEKLNDPNRTLKVVMFADMTNSTRMKSERAEIDWLGTLGVFLDIVSEAVEEQEGTIVKYLGDGALAVFGIDNAAEAINAAILTQERLDKVNREGHLRECYCTIGIATGKVVEYDAPGGGFDYVGNTVDLAARLSSKASPNAIWGDASTVASANMAKVRSSLGHLLGRSPEQYLTPEQQINLKGFSAQIRYREIIWHDHEYGARNEAVTEISRNKVTRETQASPQISTTGDERVMGTVTSWRTPEGKGYIRSLEGEDFFTDRRYLAAGTHDLETGGTVSFVKRPPFAPGERARPVAGCVIEESQTVHGAFKRLLKEREFGFLDAQDERGNHQDVFVFLGNRSDSYHEGDEVDVRIVKGRQGLKGELPAMLDEVPVETAQPEPFRAPEIMQELSE